MNIHSACLATNVTENFRENPKLTVSDLPVRSSKDVSLGNLFLRQMTLKSCRVCEQATSIS